MDLIKFPRTRHIEGSRQQMGDLSDDKPLSDLSGLVLQVTEKLDGANCAVSFDGSGSLHLQSRGHYLTSGGRERHFDLFKTWANAHAHRLLPVLSDRYIIYGEWLYAKHTVFYDRLPHFFFEFDVLDRSTKAFLSHEKRRALLSGLPVMPVPLVHSGRLDSKEDLNRLIGPSRFKSGEWRAALEEAADQSGNRRELVEQQTDQSDYLEGLYIKHEAEGVVRERYKFVRGDFLQSIEAAEGHWLDRPILPNRLEQGADIFSTVLRVDGAYDAVEVPSDGQSPSNLDWPSS